MGVIHRWVIQRHFSFLPAETFLCHPASLPVCVSLPFSTCPGIRNLHRFELQYTRGRVSSLSLNPPPSLPCPQANWCISSPLNKSLQNTSSMLDLYPIVFVSSCPLYRAHNFSMIYLCRFSLVQGDCRWPSCRTTELISHPVPFYRVCVGSVPLKKP